MQNETSAEKIEINETSGEFVGQWNKLVSTTNWEKGKIILAWREALIADGADATEYSDEKWATAVGRITGQHVGRLRRVAERFDAVRDSFSGLYWSHFQAALDWKDAEMWLEGALQNNWSVSQMKLQRWEAIGAPDDKKPSDEDIITSELNEDIEPEEDGSEEHADETVGELTEQSAEIKSDAADSITEESNDKDDEADQSDQLEVKSAKQTAELAQPFANLPELPQDVQEAFDLFKLAILHHKTNQWEEISSGDLLASLDALKSLVTAPAAEETTAT